MGAKTTWPRIPIAPGLLSNTDEIYFKASAPAPVNGVEIFNRSAVVQIDNAIKQYQRITFVDLEKIGFIVIGLHGLQGSGMFSRDTVHTSRHVCSTLD